MAEYANTVGHGGAWGFGGTVGGRAGHDFYDKIRGKKPPSQQQQSPAPPPANANNPKTSEPQDSGAAPRSSPAQKNASRYPPAMGADREPPYEPNKWHQNDSFERPMARHYDKAVGAGASPAGVPGRSNGGFPKARPSSNENTPAPASPAGGYAWTPSAKAAAAASPPRGGPPTGGSPSPPGSPAANNRFVPEGSTGVGSYGTLVVGTPVVLQGLSSHIGKKLNGQQGTLKTFDRITKRWAVQLLADGTEKSLKPENLLAIGPPPRAHQENCVPPKWSAPTTTFPGKGKNVVPPVNARVVLRGLRGKVGTAANGCCARVLHHAKENKFILQLEDEDLAVVAQAMWSG